MVDSDRKSNYEQDTANNIEYHITVDNTEASVPSTSNIIVSKGQLLDKEKSKSLLVFYDGPEIRDNSRHARELNESKKKINSY